MMALVAFACAATAGSDCCPGKDKDKQECPAKGDKCPAGGDQKTQDKKS